MNERIQRALEEAGSQRGAARLLGIPISTLRCRMGLVARPPVREQAGEAGGAGDTVSYSECDEACAPVTGSRFIITSAQNGARVHGGFLRNLEGLAKRTGARIYVSPVRHGSTIERATWDARIKKYARTRPARLSGDLLLCGGGGISPTSRDPLRGLSNWGGGDSLVIPHNAFAMRYHPSGVVDAPRELYTTGSITHPRFGDSRAGVLAAFHHVFGALFVDVSADGTWYVNHINADAETGDFHLPGIRVAGGGELSPSESVAALVMGDIHGMSADWRVMSATLGPRLDGGPCIMDILKPRQVFIHDLIDFPHRNRFVLHDPVFQARRGGSPGLVRWEISAMAQKLLGWTRAHPESRFVIVQSNHDDKILHWIKEADWKQDPGNAEFYLRVAALSLRTPDRVPLIQRVFEDLVPELEGRVDWLTTTTSHKVCGIECAMHGHLGAGGSRGSPAALARLGFKAFTAHTHSPRITDGVYVAGTSSNLRLGYNKGASDWGHAHGVIYDDGKRGFLTFRDGDWQHTDWVFARHANTKDRNDGD